jgi:RNA polymerase sigma-70 factor (ECF subfamily)
MDEGMDTELVIRAQHGDREAFTRLAGMLTARLLGISHRILRDIDLAEDATQQSLVTIWQRLPQLRDPARFEAWAHRLLVRACYAEGQRARRWASGAGLTPGREPVTVDELGWIIDRDELDRAFRRLSFDHRTVVVLRHYAHLSLEELAATLKIPVGTAASRLHYALRELRSAVQADARPVQERATP